MELLASLLFCRLNSSASGFVHTDLNLKSRLPSKIFFFLFSSLKTLLSLQIQESSVPKVKLPRLTMEVLSDHIDTKMRQTAGEFILQLPAP